MISTINVELRGLVPRPGSPRHANLNQEGQEEEADRNLSAWNIMGYV
jgi:hypothetical protein